MAYRPQVNGTTEQMVGTLTRAVKMYVEDVDQRDWDENAERLTFALNTAQDRIGGDTPFICCTLGTHDLRWRKWRYREPRRWRYGIQKQYQLAREQVNEKLREAIQERADRHNQTVRPHGIEIGSKKDMRVSWHTCDTILSMCWIRLGIAGTENRLFPLVNVSKIKSVRQFPDRPQIRLTIPNQDRYDFDEALLPEDSWIRDLDNNEYEVEKIVDMLSGRRTRYERTLREFVIYWKGYDEPT
ncbi:Reverse transcriptase [Phytophthora palmivora]|uniref:Reverse transcriptase n=1 Tax=Phytophthora palmivora TaxID=4796 RepID=A0A2P4XQ81_9STRA|nr:Reverse transcriptase [Phytophthora palmivora]